MPSVSTGYAYVRVYREDEPTYPATGPGYAYVRVYRADLPVQNSDGVEYTYLKARKDYRQRDSFEYTTALVAPIPSGVLKMWDANAGVWKVVYLKRYDGNLGQWVPIR